MEEYPTSDRLFPELIRLVNGEATALHFRPKDLTILLTPGPIYGFAENILVISGVGEKCSLIDLRDTKPLTPFIRAGLSAHAAKVLRNELERTYTNAKTTIEA